MRLFSVARPRRIHPLGGLLALGLVLAASPTPAQVVAAFDAHPVAAPSALGLELAFTPKVGDGMLLTVTGPDLHVTREFAPGAPPSFVLVGESGPLADGRYKYELRTQPSVDQRLREIATENDDEDLIRKLAREEDELTLVQAGQFEVRGGSIVLSKAEPETPVATGAHLHGGETHVHE